MTDTEGALQMLLQRDLKGSELLLAYIDRPLAALATYCRRLLASDHLLRELVRQADVEWGRRMDERPYFDREGGVSDPQDPYTVESIRHALTEAVERLDHKVAIPN